MSSQKTSWQVWTPVTTSEFAHEEQGIQALVNSLPDSPPYRVWSNFEFMDSHGGWHEVDALVLGRSRLHLVELKSWSGIFRGNEHSWTTIRPGGLETTHRNPLKTTRRKAQRLATRLETEFRKILSQARKDGLDLPARFSKVPWIQEAVFLHDEHVYSELSEMGAKNVFGLDGLDIIEGHPRLPGISTRLTEAPKDTPVSQDFARIMMDMAMDMVCGRITKTRKKAGSWTLTSQVDAFDDDQIWRAKHETHGGQALVRVSNIPESATDGQAKQIEQRVRREFSLLSSLKHEGIDAPIDMVSVDHTLPALVFDYRPSFEPLDLLLPGLKLTAEQQIELIAQIAGAVQYAHANGVVHRGLAPESILLDTQALKREREIRVLVSNWSMVGDADAAGTATVLGAPPTDTAYDGRTVFLPPEGYPVSSDRRLGDLFSIGALAFFTLSDGHQPAFDRNGLIRRLQEHGGLDLSTTAASVEESVRELILGITSPFPEKRRRATQERNPKKTDNPVQGFIGKLRAETEDRRADEGDDPLNPKTDGLIANRFSVDRVLGTGSTARGLLVNDEDGRKKVLKVALTEEKAESLRQEAVTLGKLRTALPNRARPHFVELQEELYELPYNRSALLLSNCGEHTLSDALNLGIPAPDQFWRLGTQLLFMLSALEDTGILHRDIKPANLGLHGKPSEQRLALFDFSLSGADPRDTRAGTPPYLDPFLAAQDRAFDASAERYSVAVVLLQMATHNPPVYGDGATAVELTDGQLVISADQFPASWPLEQRDRLVGFFRDCLGESPTKRPASATEMRERFADIRAIKAPSQQSASVAPTPPEPTVTVTGTTITSLTSLLETFREYSGKKNTTARRLSSLILGVADGAPTDPFIAMPGYAEVLAVTPARVRQVMPELGDVWEKSQPLQAALRTLRTAAKSTLVSLGRIATPRQLAQAVADAFPDDVSSQQLRNQLGVLRLLELAENPTSESRIRLIRRGRTKTVVALALQEELTALPSSLADAAEQALADSPAGFVAAEEVTALLTSAAAQSLGVSPANLELDPAALPEMAATGSAQIALTPTGDLYRQDIGMVSLLRLVLPRESSQIKRTLLRDRILRRFPQADNARKLPPHPQLDELIAEINPDLRYNPASQTYELIDDAAGTDLATRMTSATLTSSTPYHAPSQYRSLFSALRPTVADRGFRVISTPVAATQATADAIAVEFGARQINLSEAVLAELSRKMADSGQAELFGALLDMDRDGQRGPLNQMVRQAATTILEEAGAGDRDAVVLTDLSILADFDSLNLFRPFADISGNANDRALWLVTPWDGHAPTTAVSIGEDPIPLSSPDQLIVQPA